MEAKFLRNLSSTSDKICDYCAFRASKIDEEVSKRVWDMVRGKLLDSLEAIERATNVGDELVELEQFHVKQPLSLNAVAEGPRLRLLLAVATHLENEAGTVVLSLYSGHFAITVHHFISFHFIS